jgi:hypothetical protein
MIHPGRASIAVTVVILGMVFAEVIRPQNQVNGLDKVYTDESHCLVALEIRNETDMPMSCYCRDVLVDARYVYQTYIRTGKDLNLIGTVLTLEKEISHMCGDGYPVTSVQEQSWQWNGPEVTRMYPTDKEIAALKPDASGVRTVRYRVRLTHHNLQGRVTKVENVTFSERIPAK